MVRLKVKTVDPKTIQMDTDNNTTIKAAVDTEDAVVDKANVVVEVTLNRQQHLYRTLSRFRLHGARG